MVWTDMHSSTELEGTVRISLYTCAKNDVWLEYQDNLVGKRFFAINGLQQQSIEKVKLDHHHMPHTEN